MFILKGYICLVNGCGQCPPRRAPQDESFGPAVRKALEEAGSYVVDLLESVHILATLIYY